MPDKTIQGWLIVDWKAGTHRTRKSKPDARELGNHELLAKLEVDVHVPEVDVPTLAVEIDVPEPQVYAATMEALDDEDLPDWTDVANEIVDARGVDIAAVDADDPMLEDLVNQLTTETLIELKTRPDPRQVRNYLYRVCRELAAPEGVEADV